VFVYFCWGLSGNTEERPTRRDYIEISTCRAIILHLEYSRSHGNEAEAKRSLAQGARPRDQGARPLLESNQNSLGRTIKPDSLAPVVEDLSIKVQSRITVQSMSV